MAFKLFVSYSTLDLNEVEQLRLQLKDTPIDVFVAEHSIKPSQALAPTIAAAIEDCDLFVLLWSNNAKNSEWVSQEIGRAHALKKVILPLILTEGTALPGFIQGIRYLPAHKDSLGSLASARTEIMAAYERKAAALATSDREKKEKDALAFMGIGAFLLWVFNK